MADTTGVVPGWARRPPAAAIYDYDDRVPADVVDGWSRVEPDRAVLLDLAAFLIAGGSAIVFGISTLGLFLGFDLPRVLCAISVSAASLLAVCVVGRRLVRAGYLLPRRDMDQIVTHRLEVCFPDHLGGEEGDLAAAATVIAEDIHLASATGGSELDWYSGLLDPREEARQICVGAWHLNQVREQLGPEPPDFRDAMADDLIRQWRHLDHEVENTLEALRSRVDALRAYQIDVAEVSELTTRRAELDRLQQLSDRACSVLALDQVRHELAKDRIDDLDRGARHAVSRLHGPQRPAAPDRSGRGQAPPGH